MSQDDRSPDTLRSQGVAQAQAAMRRRAVFKRKGPLALAASAWGQEYELIAPEPAKLDGGVAVVMIMGPLTHHGDWWGGDTYDAIESRVKAALETSAGTVVLKIDSPGGEVDGAFECSRTLRRMALDAGKKLIAYVDEFAASAAYALACACNSIYLPAAARLGSIGVIDCVFDDTAYNAREGYQVAVITSGKAKADGNPNVPLTDEIRARVQANVDELAALFFALVAEARGIDPLVVKSTEAAIYRGENAVAAKLADGVVSWDELLAIIAGGASEAQPKGQSAQGAGSMKRAELIAAIKAALAEDAPPPEPDKKDGEGDDMSKADLVAALKAALEGEETPPPSKGDPDQTPPSEGAKAKALAAAAVQPQAATPPLPAPALPPGHHYLPNAQAPSPAPVDVIVALEARVQAMENEKRLAAEATERTELIASRQMSDETRKWLSNPKTSLAEVKAACKVLPKAIAQNPAAAAMARPTLAEGQDTGARASAVDPRVAREMGALMGMPAHEDPTIHWGGADPSERSDPYDRVFPTAMSAEQAREVLKRNEEALRKSNDALRAASRGAMGGVR